MKRKRKLALNERLLSAGVLPLVLWTFLLLPMIMALGGYRDPNVPAPLLFAANGFVYGLLYYPVPYIVCVIIVLIFRDVPRDLMPFQKLLTFIAAFPLIYFAVVVACFFAWVALSR